MHYVLASYCDYFAEARMQGKLYQIGNYPGAIASNNAHHIVQGELYRVINSEKVFTLLDDYEECTEQHPYPHEYQRKKLTISMVGGGTVSAWVYIYNRDVAKLSHIACGDYLRYLSNE